MKSVDADDDAAAAEEHEYYVVESVIIESAFVHAALSLSCDLCNSISHKHTVPISY